ncbi:MAG: bacillithiol biosynthesis cysteine-adding enzyme BshC [Candidatus Kapaibacterium sp.]
MDELSFRELSGFSRLFHDFLQNDEILMKRYPSNGLIDNPASLKSRMKFPKNAGLISECIERSMSAIRFDEKQYDNLRIVSNEPYLTVITGQQVGFLGGPYYTQLKAASVTALADKLNDSASDLNIVPLFWVEDNDHDNLEASLIHLFDKDASICSINCGEHIPKNDRTIVAGHFFNNNIADILTEVRNMLPDSIYKMEIFERLQSIYTPGKSWADAFIEFMQQMFGHNGLLFVKASEVRKAGLFKDGALNELETPCGSAGLIEEANVKLKKDGYHIQARCFDINLFYVEDGYRHNIEYKGGMYHTAGMKLKREEIMEICESNPEKFAPKVLLRPVFQDSIFPNAAYVGGPSEIGYVAQVKELYDKFSVDMPAFVPRHSATLISNYTAKVLERINQFPSFFFDDPMLIENKLKHSLISFELASDMEDAEKQVMKAFKSLSLLTFKIDKNLEATARATEHKIKKLFDRYRRKTYAAVKKKNNSLFADYNYCSRMIYPNETLSERLISPLNYINEAGLDFFKKALDGITSRDPDKHYIIEL